ncbi:VOC family protein [Mucilaginibacter limnophilus]|nr:hypothetical protein [Mucilaginibacter limnophilus]
MVISNSIFVMLLTEPYFATFTKKQVSDVKSTTEVLITLDAESREEVQQIIAKAQTLDATLYSEPQDHGWMYQHGFADLDGHQGKIAYLDASQLPAQES